MNTRTASPSHEWWKDRTDADGLSEFVNSYRSGQREQFVAGWRRNAMLGVLAVSFPVLLHLVGTIAGA